MPRGGGRGRGHHGHHGGRHHGGPHWGGPGPRGRGWGRPPPGRIFGGPIWGPPPPGPRPGPGPIVGAAVLGGAVVGAAVAADADAAARRQREIALEQERQREHARRQRQLAIEEEERQIQAAKAASAKEESERLAREQAKLEQQQKELEQKMAQLNMMKQSQQQSQQQQQPPQQAVSGSSANWSYYGTQNIPANSSGSLNELEGQPGAAPNSAVTNAYPQQSSQQQQQQYSQSPQAVQPPVNPNYSYYPQQQVETPAYPGYNYSASPPRNQQQYQQQYPQQQSQVPQNYGYQQASQPGQQIGVPQNYKAPPAYAPGADNGNSSEISYPKLSKPSTKPVANNPPPPSYNDHVAARGSVSSSISSPPNQINQINESNQPGQAAFIKPPPIGPADDEKSLEMGNTDDGGYFEGPMGNIRSKQPMDDPRPTLNGINNYTEAMALEDAKELRKAMKGWGTKEHPIIKIAGTRNVRQRQQIKEAFVNVDSILYNDNKQRDLIKDLKSELSGHLKEIVLSLFLGPGGYDARLIEQALAGSGYNQTLLIEVLCTRTNEEIELMKNAWDLSFKQSLKERVHKETNKWFAVGNFQSLMDSILDCKRDESSGNVNKELAKQDAELLNRVMTQDKKKEAKIKFVEIFSTRSWEHLRQLSNDFNEISKKYTLVAAIATTFGEGATSNAMRVILEFSMQPYDFWAKRLKVAMNGIGTNDKLLKRVIISRCEIDLNSIAEVFGQRYGDGKTLGKWLKDDTSGFYKEILLYLTNYHS